MCGLVIIGVVVYSLIPSGDGCLMIIVYGSLFTSRVITELFYVSRDVRIVRPPSLFMCVCVCMCVRTCLCVRESCNQYRYHSSHSVVQCYLNLLAVVAGSAFVCVRHFTSSVYAAFDHHQSNPANTNLFVTPCPHIIKLSI